MRSETRTALWVAAATIATATITWGFSFAGGSFIFQLLGFQVPWFTIDRELLLLWQVVGLVVAFLLVLLAVRLLSAPPALWLGALAACALLAGPYVIGYLELRLAGAQQDSIDRILWGRPFYDPRVALLALVSYPLAVGCACWLATWLRRRSTSSPQVGEASHA